MTDTIPEGAKEFAKTAISDMKSTDQQVDLVNRIAGRTVAELDRGLEKKDFEIMELRAKLARAMEERSTLQLIRDISQMPVDMLPAPRFEDISNEMEAPPEEPTPEPGEEKASRGSWVDGLLHRDKREAEEAGEPVEELAENPKGEPEKS